MYIYIHIFPNIYIYIYIYVCVCVCVCVYIYIHAQKQTYINKYYSSLSYHFCSSFKIKICLYSHIYKYI